MDAVSAAREGWPTCEAGEGDAEDAGDTGSGAKRASAPRAVIVAKISRSKIPGNAGNLVINEWIVRIMRIVS
jgi:hypothetical protein